MDELDLGGIVRVVQAKDARGERPYSPEMMTALLPYAMGVYSSRRIARACVEDVVFRVLAAGEQPHVTTINQFRARHLEALPGSRSCRHRGGQGHLAKELFSAVSPTWGCARRHSNEARSAMAWIFTPG